MKWIMARATWTRRRSPSRHARYRCRDEHRRSNGAPISAPGAAAAKFGRQRLRIAFGPDDRRAAGAKIREIDPGRMTRQSVDQYARLRSLARIMRDVAAVPHRADDIVRLLPVASSKRCVIAADSRSPGKNAAR